MNQQLKDFLDNSITTHTDHTKATVLPIPCGIGKSTWVKYAIADALNSEQGLIVVTDSVDRLTSYTNTDGQADLAEYIDRNRDKFEILTAATITNAYKTLYRKRVVLLTTQRYFSMSLDEIQKLTANRGTVIFDEKPLVFEVVKVDTQSLHNVLVALHDGLDDTVSQKDKQSLIDHWQTVMSKLEADLQNNEEQNREQTGKTEKFYRSDIDLSDFITLANKYRQQLRKFGLTKQGNTDVIKVIEAVDQLTREGTITSSKMLNKQSENEYHNYFTALINNAIKLVNIGSKVFILDGTANVSPEYKLKCFEFIDCAAFKRDLKNLTINIVDISASKTKLTQSNQGSYIRCIIDFLKKQPDRIEAVFSYKQLKTRLEQDFELVNWFGNIKGTNQYINRASIGQIGVNRYSDLVYVLYANEIGRFNDEDDTIIQRVYDTQTIAQIRCGQIVADIEQNLYRCAIRNIENRMRCTYTIVTSHYERSNLFESYDPLVAAIQKRFAGASINLIDTPPEIKQLKIMERKTKKRTVPQRIIEWIDSKPKGYVFKIKQLRTELKISYQQYKNALDNDYVAMRIAHMKSPEKKGYYTVD